MKSDLIMFNSGAYPEYDNISYIHGWPDAHVISEGRSADDVNARDTWNITITFRSFPARLVNRLLAIGPRIALYSIMPEPHGDGFRMYRWAQAIGVLDEYVPGSKDGDAPYIKLTGHTLHLSAETVRYNDPEICADINALISHDLPIGYIDADDAYAIVVTQQPSGEGNFPSGIFLIGAAPNT